MNHFRAIAIIIVVAGHCYGIAVLRVSTTVEKIAVNLLAGSTDLFAFISGFLFHHVFYKKYQYQSFVLGKIKNVFIPYLLLGALPVLLFVYQKTDGRIFFLSDGSGIFRAYVVPALKYYGTGAFLTAYWYVPFIMMMFMLSPLHYLFIKSRPALQFGLTVMFCISAILIHRPVENIDILQSIIYFTPVYLIGILCSEYRNKIYGALNGMEPILLALIVSLAALQENFGYVGNYHKLAFAYGGLDILFIQKILMCLFLLISLKRFESVNNKIIHAVATTSFTVYFLHSFILWGISRAFGKYLALDSWMMFSLYVAAIVMLCVGIAKATKKAIPKYSRFLPGY